MNECAAPALAELLERETAIARLRSALAAGANLLVHAPAGMGKTALLRRGLPLAPRPLFCAGAAPAAIYGQALAALQALGDACVASLLAARGLQAADLPRLPSFSRRGWLEKALAGGRYCLVLDPAPRASAAFARQLTDLLRRTQTPLVCAAPADSSDYVGALISLFPFRENRLALLPLSPAAARQFMQARLQQAGVSQAEAREVMRQLLPLAHGAPGRIEQFARLAAEARYRRPEGLKLHSLYLDVLMASAPAKGRKT